MYEEKHESKIIVFPILFKNLSLNPCDSLITSQSQASDSCHQCFLKQWEKQRHGEILSLFSQLGKNFPELGMLPTSHKPHIASSKLNNMVILSKIIKVLREKVDTNLAFSSMMPGWQLYDRLHVPSKMAINIKTVPSTLRSRRDKSDGNRYFNLFTMKVKSSQRIFLQQNFYYVSLDRNNMSNILSQ